MLPPLLLLAFSILTTDNPGSSAPLRQHETADTSAEPSPPLVREGSVLDTDGAPAHGALVVSSAGGRAVVDASGHYRLELLVPADARELQVTAVGARGANLLASTRVALESPFDAVLVRPLLLAQGSSCAPGWLPTFGEAPGVVGTVYALTVFDDGSGPSLYAGWTIVGAGTLAATRVVKWG